MFLDIDLKTFLIIYFSISLITLLLNAFIAGISHSRVTIRDYIDSLLFPVTYTQLLGVIISGICSNIHFRYKNAKNSLNALKEQEVLKKLKKREDSKKTS